MFLIDSNIWLFPDNFGLRTNDQKRSCDLLDSSKDHTYNIENATESARKLSKTKKKWTAALISIVREMDQKKCIF